MFSRLLVNKENEFTLSRTSRLRALSPRTRAFSCCSFHNRCLSETNASIRSCSTTASCAASPLRIKNLFYLNKKFALLLVDHLLLLQDVLQDGIVML